MSTLRERIQAAVMDVLPGIVETELPGGRIVGVELEDDLPDEITDAVMRVLDEWECRPDPVVLSEHGARNAGT